MKKRIQILLIYVFLLSIIIVTGCTTSQQTTQIPLRTKEGNTKPVSIPTSITVSSLPTTIVTAIPVPIATPFENVIIVTSGYGIAKNDSETFSHDARKVATICDALDPTFDLNNKTLESLISEWKNQTCYVIDFTNLPNYPAVNRKVREYDKEGKVITSYQDVYSLATNLEGGDLAYYNKHHRTAYCECFIPDNETYWKIEEEGIRL